MNKKKIMKKWIGQKLKINLTLLMYNKQYLSNNENCGCAKCCKLFKANEIKKWTDQGRTAICPFCSVDAILSETNISNLNENILIKVNKELFN